MGNALGFALVAGLLGFGQVPESNAVRVDVAGTSYSSLSETVTVFAVCSMSDGGVNCWNSLGAPAPNVTEYIRAYFLVNNATIPMRPGGKNRYIVATRTDKNRPGNGMVDWSDIAGNVPNVVYGGMFQRQTPKFHWYHASLASDATTFTATARFTENWPAQESLALKPGATVSTNRGTVTLKSWRPATMDEKLTYGVAVAKNKAWVVEFAEVVKDPTQSLNLSLADAQGDQYPAVDADGRPTKVDPLNFMDPNAQMIRFHPTADSPMSYFCNMDPEQAASVHVSTTRTILATFRDLLADPKP